MCIKVAGLAASCVRGLLGRRGQSLKSVSRRLGYGARNSFLLRSLLRPPFLCPLHPSIHSRSAAVFLWTPYGGGNKILQAPMAAPSYTGNTNVASRACSCDPEPKPKTARRRNTRLGIGLDELVITSTGPGRPTDWLGQTYR